MNTEKIEPYPGEVEEAKHFPNGWVYRIAGNFAETEDVPPGAIVGAWQVDENGSIIGEFERNSNYDPAKCRLYHQGERLDGSERSDAHEVCRNLRHDAATEVVLPTTSEREPSASEVRTSVAM